MGSRVRPLNWDVALIAWAEHLRGSPFEWGVTDCAILCLEAFDIMSGRWGQPDGCGGLAEQYRGRYADERAARRFQVLHDVDLRKKLVAAGCTPVAPNFQQCGDFLLESAGGFVCGHVCLGLHALSATPESGVQMLPVRELIARPWCEILRAP